MTDLQKQSGPNQIGGLNLAFQPEIIRANQKDEEYQTYTFQQMIKGIEILIPHIISYRTISKHKTQLKLIASIIYYGFNTLQDAKTLGKLWSSIVRQLPDYNGIIEKIFKINLTIFFIKGDFLQISKRLQSISYVFSKTLPKHGITYAKVGYLISLQLLIEFMIFVYKVKKDQQKIKRLIRDQEEEEYLNENQKLLKDDQNDEIQDENQNLDEFVEKEQQCGVCLYKRVYTTATPCGHLFCWECVLKYINFKQECPNCRQPVKCQQLVQLRNFS